MNDATESDGPQSAARRRLLAAAAAVPAAALAGDATAQDAASGVADFLFVQTAKATAFSAHENRLTLRGVSPLTLFFADRPDRIAGQMTTARFIPFWGEGSDSFLSDPPNADLSVLTDKGDLQQVVVVLRDPALVGEDLRYTVRIIDGAMPEIGENASLFIDIIGMPLTPLSFAGVRRRAWRRALWR